MENLNLVSRLVRYVGVLYDGCGFGRLRLGYLRKSRKVVNQDRKLGAKVHSLFPEQIAESSDGILSILDKLMRCLIPNVLQRTPIAPDVPHRTAMLLLLTISSPLNEIAHAI